LQLFAGTGGVFRRDHPYHLEDVGLEAHSPHLGHHGRGHGLVAGEGAELVHLVLEKERVFAAAFQQGRRRTLGEGGVLRLGAVHHHDLQLVGLGFGQLFGKADLGTLGDELLRPLAQFELIALHLEHAAQHHHGILEAGQRGAQLVEVFVAVGGGVHLGQKHHAPRPEEGDGACRHDELLDFGRSTVQNGRFFVLTLGQKLCRPGHSLSDKIALAGIKIVDRTATLGQLPEFRFRCQMIGSFVFGLFYSIILCPL